MSMATATTSAHDALDAARLLAELPPPARARVATLHVAAQTASTQADALAAPVPTQGCAVFLAERQVAGQGRRGRAWVSGDGNLALSIARRMGRPLRDLAGLPLAAGIAVADALHALGVREAGLKWPNDIVAGQRKLGGLLVNSRAEGAGSAIVVGIGLNVALADGQGDAIDQPWCDLAGLGHRIGREALAVAVVAALVEALERFDAEGFAPFAARWPAHDAHAGRAVRVIDGERVVEGIVLGIDATGALQLRCADGDRVFHGGELSVRPL
jgi:BirA family biotin operon repressor/biotin-[acetyl-CoA-carboxylase] ligase